MVDINELQKGNTRQHVKLITLEQNKSPLFWIRAIAVMEIKPEIHFMGINIKLFWPRL